MKDFNPNEALIWSELTHPGIVRLLGVVRTGVTICFYSASVARRTLKSLVSNDRVLSQGDALWYLEQMLSILVYVHEMQVLHKDLKRKLFELRSKSCILQYSYTPCLF